MLPAETMLAVGQQPPIHSFGLLVAALQASQPCEDALGSHGVGMVVSEDPPLVGKKLAEHVLRFVVSG